jgi:hypothetical protein
MRPGAGAGGSGIRPLRLENDSVPNNTSNKRPAKRVNKREKALTLMRRPNGATITELTKATGWQPHSARAVISGLRREGHAITLTERDSGESRYVLAERD